MYRTIRTIRFQRRVHSQRKTRTHRTHRTASMGRVHAPSSHPDRSEKRQSHHLPATQRKGNTMSTSKTPRTIVEVIEEVPADAGIPLIRVSHEIGTAHV